MSITGAVRVIKGQEVLPDGNTLEEHGITDGSTVNIIIEPEKEIKLNMEHGPFEGPFKVSSSVSVRDLKQRLIDGNIVGFSFNEFRLMISAGNNPDGVATDVPLVDESLPLHLCGMSDITTIKIIGNNVQVILVTQRGQNWYKSFPKNITVSQMKQRIRLVDRLFTDKDKDKDLLDDIWLFVQRGDDDEEEDDAGESYRKLDDETPVGSVLFDNDVIYIVEDRFFAEKDLFPIFIKGEEVGRVGWKIMYSEALGLKLRIQQLFGFPVSRIDVKLKGKSMQNNHRIVAKNVNKTADIFIEVR